MNLILNLGLTLVIAAGAFRVNDGLTQPGELIAFLHISPLSKTPCFPSPASSSSIPRERLRREDPPVLDAPEIS
jgi:hypothetical protein